MLPRRLVACLLMLLPLAVEAQGFPRLEALADDGFRIGAEARLLGNGEPGATLGSLAPREALSPASVSKVYLAAAALDRFGPQHRFTTRLLGTAEPDAAGVLDGDLILEGGGDPALTTEDLWRLVQRLHQAGVREVSGRLVVSQWRFGPVTCITTDRCEGQRRVDNAYSALLSSAAVNYGNWCVTVAPARTPGEPAVVTGCDSQSRLPAIDNRVTTRPDDSGTQLTAERLTRDGEDIMRVAGRISTNAHPRQVYRTSSDPAEQAARLLQEMLGQAGIEVAGERVTTTLAPPAGAHRLAAVDGEPLQELLLRTLNYSNNFMADTLALNLAETPRPTLVQAGDAIEAFAEGLPGHGELRLDSGSGLTPENRTTAAGTNALLEHMFRRPALFPSFVAALQSPGNGVMRFIRRGSEAFQHHVMLKTGTLNQPVTVRAVAGYFRTRSGRWGVFTVLVNGTASTPYLSWSRVLDRLSVDLDAMIEAH
ncbi:D-alanyl-D-alanine carboxypeptidase/D-alanyl-D-alanine endopeptidase [Halomonas koreensis]|uniref:D-alanyl-D-alanine carboxypeptidase/D-alanyl-D-alanine-endopeptidase n=1 Tax=Halomonas koreensis TaxID=245385 RepID=A0ABU1G5X1_9GAMM|nr:D-alanyl-D-alanine carboxypeptidase/D-alanyl-D-alanine-endopeptidase [Halomonas koreensis]MDR5868337.1 D-alanyl-D-alanine carboxypeptidase/D-alanyl-D-alanine-endopeptidase [Halomonas koreensis]